jgi:hypothetical protein
VQPDAPRRLRDASTLLQRVIDAVDAICLHCNQETAAELRVGCSSVEEGWRCVCEPALAHQLVSVACSLDILLVDPNSNPHEHVLWPLHDGIVEPEQIGALQGLEAEVVIIKVPVINDF